MIPLEPVLLTVVLTEIPVVAMLVFEVVVISIVDPLPLPPAAKSPSV